MVKKWNIVYDEIVFGKPWPGPDGIYVDDRTIRPRELVEKSPDEIEQLLIEGRL